MDSTNVPMSALDRALDRELAAVSADVARTDNKASLLLALTGGVLIAGVASLGKAPASALALAAAGIAAAAVSALLSVLVVMPRLDSARSNGFSRWARCEADEIREALAVDDHLAVRLHALSVICERKMRLLQWSARCALVAVLSVSAAALLSAAA
ncbi:Pycsar system effector family protein [Kitasatospora sp. NPDC101235]|uniref:Pycsar system effector family protein n=1 Tax=Kitasatospora sp. NPDC101235 TaxID=3364101 RepID=UPI003805031B